MSQIRQEFNILDRNVSSSSAVSGNIADAYFNFNPSQFNGTITSYLEILAINNDSTNKDVTVTIGATTLTCTIPTGTSSFTLVRSSGATIPQGSSATDTYLSFPVTTSNGQVQVKSARIISTQNVTDIFKSQTWVELGNVATTTSTTFVATTNPKYWYYDSTKWDGTLTVALEVLMKCANSKSATTAVLQVSDSSSIAAPTWADVTNSTLTTTATNPARVRSPASITLTADRWYRVAYKTGTSKSAASIYESRLIINQKPSTSVSQLVDSVVSSPVWGGSGTSEQLGQSFTVGGSDISVTAISLFMFKVASLTDNIYLEIAPTSISTAASATSASVASTSLGTSLIPSWETFLFSSPVALSASTKYYIRLIRDGARDTTNYTTWEYSSASSYASNGAYTKTSGVWGSESATNDFMFMIHTGAITKLEPEYLLANTLFAAGTALQVFTTKWDSTEWSGVTNTYYFQADAANGSTSDVELWEADGGGSGLGVLTNIDNSQISSSVTMPTSQNMDTKATTNAGDVASAKILVATVVNSAPAPSVFDSLTITESVTVSNPLTGISVSDSITVSESVTVVNIGSVATVSVSDSLTISESVSVLLFTPTKYYLKALTSDLTGGADFSREISTPTETAGSITVSVANSSTETSYGFTKAHKPSNAAWETGGVTVLVNVTTAHADMFLSIQVDRINSSGTVQESSTATAEQNINSTGVKTFNVSSTNWTAGSCDDRMRVRYIFRSAKSTGPAASVVIETGTTNTSITPANLMEVSGACVGLFTTDAKQFGSDHSTVISTGGVTTEGITDNIYLDTRISSWDTLDTITMLDEVRKVGTTFTDSSTSSANLALQYNPAVPHIRRAHTTVYDPTLKRMLLFGGWDGTTRFNDVYELTLNSYISPQPQWRLLSPTGTPPSARTTHNAFFDQTNNRMIVGFGNDGTEKNDMLSLSFASSRDGAWTTLSPTGGPPAVRGQASMANDIANTKAYLVAGWGAAARFNDIWEFNYSTTNGAWTQKSADGAGAAMSRRNDPATVWDATNSRLVMFGGYDGSTWKADTWQYVPGTDTWTDKTAVFSGTPPAARELMFSALDTTNNRMVIFGGRNGTGSANIQNDYAYLTLTAASETWNVVSGTTGERPSGAWTNAGCYDPEHKLFICFGGLDSSVEVNRYLLAIDCSSSSTLTMKAIVLNQYLRGRDATGYAYNTDRDETLIAGGFARIDSVNGSLFNGDHTNDLWIYRHATADWVLALRTEVAIRYTPREGVVVVYDTNRDRFILFGGLTGNGATQLFYNDLYEVKADTEGVYRITKLAPTGSKPTARWLAAAVYDSVNDRMVIFGGDDGGSYLNDVNAVSFSGGADGAWSSISPSGTPPSGRRQASYAYDSGENAMMVSHGGLTVNTFASNSFKLSLGSGTEAWTNMSPSGSPPAGRRGMTAVYRAADDKFYLFGGYDGTNHYNDLYSLESDASPAWATLTPTGTIPLTRRSHAAGYSPVSGKMMIYGGRESTYDTWDSRNNTHEYNVTGNSWANADPKIYINGSVPVTSLEKGWSYHWQTWVTGLINRLSAKSSYGGNAETATDFATLFGPYDSITLTESVTVSIVTDTSLTINVFDGITLTESVTVENPTGYANVFDSVTITESVQIDTQNNVNIFDSITITESVVLELVSFVNVFDSITITENVVIERFSFISVSDLITLTESVTVENPTGYTSVFDTITLTESVTMLVFFNLSVSDSITLTESVVVENPTGYANVFDSITLTENNTELLESYIVVFDSLSLTESVSIDNQNNVNVFDGITLTESVTVAFAAASDLSVNVFDGITLTESVQLEIVSFVSVFDSITITESVTLERFSFVNVIDAITITESVSIDDQNNINVFDAITITESVTLEMISHISISDSVTITESVTVQNPTGYTSVVDTITLTENISTLLESYINVSDTIVLTENLTEFGVLSISISDSITLTESVNIDKQNNISVFDALTLSESTTLEITSFINVFDSITLTESVTLLVFLNISVSDSLTITESVSVENPTGYTSVSDSITITETTSFLLLSYINVSDTITLTENVSVVLVAASDFSVSVSDSITLTESVILELISFVSIFDSITITESITVENPTGYASVVDTLNLTESITLLTQSFINVFDTITLTENLSELNTLSISVSDTVTLTENVNVDTQNNISVFDLITLTESQTFLLLSFIDVFDSITITENVNLLVFLNISVSDVITITESVVVENPTGYTSVVDNVTITENTNLLLLSFVDVFDLITITESVTVVFAAVSDFNVSVSDLITLTEDTTEELVSFVNVFDSITITESVTVQNPTGYTSVFDTVTLTEFIQIDTQNNISVFDTITLTENLSELGEFNVSLFDSVTITESVQIDTQNNVNVFDLITITESVSLLLISNINVFDGLTITENVETAQFSSVSVSDTINLTELVTVQNPTGYTSVFDVVTLTEFVQIDTQNNISVSDLITLTESVTTHLESFISVSDSITLTESVVVILLSDINVSDQMNLTESVTVENPTGYTSVFDIVTLTENVTVIVEVPGAFSVSVNDVVNLTENTTLLLQGFISVSDTVTLTENVNIDEQNNISVSDLITLTENVNIDTQNNVSVFDLITLTESVNVEQPISLSVFDSVSITENVVIELVSFVSVSDTINPTESVTVQNSTGYTSVTDIITIIENVSLELSSFVNVFDLVTLTENLSELSALNISVSDLISTTEIVLLEKVSFANVFDSITITESVQMDNQENINVFEAIQTTEFIKIDDQNNVSVFDSITLTESVQAERQSNISVSDSITLTESVSTTGQLSLSVNDTVTITENNILLLQSYISIADNVTLTENLSETGFLNISVSDSISLTESITIENPTGYTSVVDNISLTESVQIDTQNNINVFDGVTITENVSIEVLSGVALSCSVSDSITITESIVASNPTGFTSVFDTIIVSENVETSGTSTINVFDSITLTESVNVDRLHNLSVFDSITITENLSDTGEGSVYVHDTLNLSESYSVALSDMAVSVFDSITITENVVSYLSIEISVFDGVTITENLSDTGQTGLSKTEDISISESITMTISDGVVSIVNQLTLTESVNVLLISLISIVDSLSLADTASAESFRFSPSTDRPVGRRGRHNGPPEGRQGIDS